MSDDLVTWLRAEIRGDLGIARHILDVHGARPDARVEMHDAIADCEAKLAILDLYETQAARESDNAMEEDRTWILAVVIRRLGSGYRYRPGYREEWKP